VERGRAIGASKRKGYDKFGKSLWGEMAFVLWPKFAPGRKASRGKRKKQEEKNKGRPTGKSTAKGFRPQEGDLVFQKKRDFKPNRTESEERREKREKGKGKVAKSS